MYIILPINNFPERISYLSGKGKGAPMLRFLIKRNLSTLSTVMVLLWIFMLPFLESWWYIYQIIQGNYAYQPDCAFFLCGNSVGIGHIFQGLYLWLIPLYCLVISSNDCLMDQERGYDNILISRIGKRKMLYRLLIKNFILLSVLVFLLKKLFQDIFSFSFFS